MSEEISREEIAALLARGSEEMTREEAIVVLQGYLDNPLINNKEPFNMAISALSEQRTGHWIDTADEINAKYGKHDYKCSKCGKYAEYFIAGTEDWWSCEKPNYCPYCGAKRIDPQESEEQA